MGTIHPTAVVDPEARVHDSVSIGPYAIIEKGAVIGPECQIEGHAYISGLTRLGRGNRVGYGTALGIEPQVLDFQPDRATPLVIGDHNRFREHVTISAGSRGPQGTRIGHRNYFMAGTHVGHDCQVGDGNILANGATLAGHVELGHRSFLSGQVAVHQFCRIGSHAMVAGVSGVPQDVPPFAIADGHRARIRGVNLVGLRRHGFTSDQRRRIRATYRILFRSGLPLPKALIRAEQADSSPETDAILRFIRASQRGILSPA